jgi:hypothetical protein
MSVDLSVLGINGVDANEVEAQTVSEGGFIWDSGAYDVVVKEAVKFMSSGGAGMFKLVVADKDERELTIYTNIVKKSGEANEFGTRDLVGLIDAVGCKDLGVKPVISNCYGKEVDAQLCTGLVNKKFKALVRLVEDQSNDKYPLQNEIQGYATTEGHNKKGEDIVEAYMKKIAKTPVMVRKAKGGSKPSSTNATPVDDGSDF